jgi:DNA-binding transcriptional LysR family regulator
LEAALGTRLLNRARTGATLTKAGYAFHDQAELIVTTWENARARASLPAGVTRMFSLVCDPSLWSGLGANWTGTLRADHPETAMDIWAGLAADARRWLHAGLSDAALLTEPLTGAEFAHRRFAKEVLVQVSTRPRATVPWDPAYVFVDYGPDFRAQHALTWAGDDTAQVSFSNPDWAHAHLLEHGGSAYLPQAMVDASEALHPVTAAPTFTRTSYLSWRKASEQAFPWLA